MKTLQESNKGQGGIHWQIKVSHTLIRQKVTYLLGPSLSHILGPLQPLKVFREVKRIIRARGVT